jgi:hypothetical protein
MAVSINVPSDAALDPVPGFNPKRLVNLMKSAVSLSGLDLSGITVLTEAASGAYATTAVIAAIAGAAKVYARACDSRYGSASDLASEVLQLARIAGVSERIEIFEGKPHAFAGKANIVTNSGHLRPIDAALIAALPQGAVIALMYEPWEFRPADIDIDACRKHAIPVVGVNERHPAVDVFSFLGPLAVRLLQQAGISVYKSRIIVLCDNPFGIYIWRGLKGLGSEVTLVNEVDAIPHESAADALLVAMQPTSTLAIDKNDAVSIAERIPGAIVAQYWGDIDRTALQAQGLPVWPPNEPKPGHMGILLSALGPEPVIRLQAGGLRAAELAYRSEKLAYSPGGIAEPLPDIESCLK